jgi:hypothetical protein
MLSVAEWVSTLRLRNAAKTSPEAKRLRPRGTTRCQNSLVREWRLAVGRGWRGVCVWGGGRVRMAAHCNATQRFAANRVSGALCESPTGAAVAARRERWLSSLAVVLHRPVVAAPLRGENTGLSLKRRRSVTWLVAWRSRNQDAPNRPLCRRRWIRSRVAGAAPSISLADEAEEPGG